MARRVTTEDFIKRANELHNGKYTYEKSIYNGWKSDLIVTCPEHGDFIVGAAVHAIHGQGCQECIGRPNKG